MRVYLFMRVRGYFYMVAASEGGRRTMEKKSTSSECRKLYEKALDPLVHKSRGSWLAAHAWFQRETKKRETQKRELVGLVGWVGWVGWVGCVGWVGWCVGLLACWLVGLLVGWLVGLVGWLAG